MIVLLWFDNRYLDYGKLVENSFNNYDEFGQWLVKNYKHVHIVDIKERKCLIENG